ncbi:MAG: DUF2500 domain-containing protein [Lachnospiraceae bacterium]|nr:DUF2500 domain-containing protein [Lachnospiraceae bacterium]
MGIIFGTGLFEVMFIIVFVFVIGTFVAAAVRGVSTWNKNNHSPRLTVRATVVSKRMDVRHQHHAHAGDVTGTHGYYGTSATDYFATFQVESGDRMELAVAGSEYGMLVEGDEGNLTFQGTRYLSFIRF